MKKRFRILSGALCAGMLLGGISVFAKSTSINEAQAKETAWTQVPRTCTYLTTDLERYWYEIKYFDTTNQQKHTVQVGKNTGAVLERTVETAGPAPTKTVSISRAQAENALRAQHTDLIAVSAKLVEEAQGSWYEVTFRSATKRGAARVNAQTGVVTYSCISYPAEKDYELLGVVKNTSNTDDTTTVVWEGSIRDAVTQQVPGAMIDKIMLTGNSMLYDVKAHLGDYEYDLLYNAQNGNRIAFSSSYDPTDLSVDWYQKPGSVKKPAGQGGTEQIRETNGTLSTEQYIGKMLAGSKSSLSTSALSSSTASTASTKSISQANRERAKRVAMRMAPEGAQLKSMTLKSSGGVSYYEGWLKHNGVRYAFRIDANDGSVLNSSTEIDETWDPNAHHDVDSIKEEDKDYEMKWDD